MTPRQWLIVITASIGAMLEVVDVSITNVALVHIQANLGATLAEVGWVVTGYAMASVVVIPLSEWLTEVFGQKRYFLLSLLGFTAASMACGLALNLPLLVVARILQGLLGGGLMPMAQSIMFRAVPKHQQGMAQGVFGVVVLAGPALGPTLGGFLTDTLGWRWVFFINLPIGLLTGLIASRAFPADQTADRIDLRSRGVDWVGIGLLALGLACLQVVLEQGHQYDWLENPGIRRLALLAALALPLFVWWELRRRHPAVDLRVLRHRSLAAGSVFSFVLGVGLYGTVFVVPIFAQTVLQYTATQTGLLMLPGALASAFTMAVLGRNAHRFDPRWLIATGAVLMVATMFTLSAVGPNTGEHSLFWPLIFRGSTTVMMFLPLSLAALGPLPRSDVGSGSGFFNLSRQLGGTFGIAGLTVLLNHQQAVHRAQLVDHLDVANPLLLQRIQLLEGAMATTGGDLDTAREQAIAVLNHQVDLQAALLAYGDVFRTVGGVFLMAIPLVLLLGSPQGGLHATASE
jgi:DHA2 family multidrug resistance protein